MRERFAIVDGKKAEATPKTKGICPHCESEMIAECGRVKVWHWAHKGNPHSTLKPEERISREEFYKEMVWVVDGNIGELDENYLVHPGRAYFRLKKVDIHVFQKAPHQIERHIGCPQACCITDFVFTATSMFAPFLRKAPLF